MTDFRVCALLGMTSLSFWLMSIFTPSAMPLAIVFSVLFGSNLIASVIVHAIR
jgi:hypothetical protein